MKSATLSTFIATRFPVVGTFIRFAPNESDEFDELKTITRGVFAEMPKMVFVTFQKRKCHAVTFFSGQRHLKLVFSIDSRDRSARIFNQIFLRTLCAMWREVQCKFPPPPQMPMIVEPLSTVLTIRLEPKPIDPSTQHSIVGETMKTIQFEPNWTLPCPYGASAKLSDPSCATIDSVHALHSTIREMATHCTEISPCDVTSILEIINRILTASCVRIDETDETRDDIFVALSLLTTYKERFGDKYILTDVHALDCPVVVVGDIHGSLPALYFHFLCAFKAGAKILFLGDFLDRGPNGIESLLLPTLLRIMFPQSVHMIRGNHETIDVFRIYGTRDELRSKKVARDFTRYFVAIQSIVDYFPIVAIVYTKTEKVACVHGLFTGDIVLSELRRQYNLQSLLCSNIGTEPDDQVSKTINDMMWSDPHECPLTTTSVRGVGSMVGSDDTQRFCDTNKVDRIVRAHQVVKKGYEILHDGRVITIFGRPDYCDKRNHGAFMILGNSDSEIYEFTLADISGLRILPTAPIADTQAVPFHFS